MFRLYGVAIFYFYICLIFLISINRAIKKNKPLDEKYKLARKIIKTISKLSLIKVETYGLENLPKEDGYILCPNHQGKYDGHAVIVASERQLTFVLDKKRSNSFLEKQFMDLIEAERLDRTNLRSCVYSFEHVKKNIVERKMNYCIFPEGKHCGNKNELLEFKTGFTHFIYKTGSPVIPVCLYDTYKPYNSKKIGKVKCQVHILEPILYEEYKDMEKRELVELLKSRIQAKLDEIKKEKAEKNK